MILATIFVLATVALPQTHGNCTFSASNFPPPVAPACLPPAVMDWSCLYICDHVYSSQMARNARRYCLAANAAWADYDVDVNECLITYDMCQLSGGTDCTTTLNKCLDAATGVLTKALNNLQDTQDAADNLAEASHAACAMNCCHFE